MVDDTEPDVTEPDVTESEVTESEVTESLGETMDSAVPPPPQAVRTIFGDRAPLAERYAAHLAATGISHGLIGPREIPRVWERHILNCAVVAETIPAGVSVIDVGSGAGLPGLCIALARPDLAVTLVEPMERRTTWLESVREDLGLDAVVVVRSRAEELHGSIAAEVVSARAVAPLDKLARWCLPLVEPGGRLVAMKGSSAEREIAAATIVLRRLGGRSARVETCGADVLDTPTTVVVVDKERHPPARDRRGSRVRR